MEESRKMEYEKRLEQLTPDQLDYFIKYINVLREYEEGTSTLSDVIRVNREIPEEYKEMIEEILYLQ